MTARRPPRRSPARAAVAAAPPPGRAIPLLALAALAAALVLALPGRARGADLTVDVWAGFKRFDAVTLRSAVANVSEDDLLDGSYNAVGATAILKLDTLEVGALYEGGLSYDSTRNAVLAPLVGVGFDVVEVVRVELLAEFGGQRYSDIADSGESTWLPYVGLRPGVSYRMDLTGPVRLVLGAWGFARWDVDRDTVRAGAVGSPIEVRVGGSTYGLVGRVGIEI
jgi:hypothetical protein